MEVIFDEDRWIKVLFLLSDIQEWLNEISKSVICQIPLENKRKLFRKTYYITVTGLAHLLERHYYRVSRHPEAAKFIIPIPEILSYLREAYHQVATPVLDSLSSRRVIDTGKTIGFDKYGNCTTKITVVTDSGG